MVLSNFHNKLRAVFSIGFLIIAAKPKPEYGNITSDKLFWVLQYSGKFTEFTHELICKARYSGFTSSSRQQSQSNLTLYGFDDDA